MRRHYEADLRAGEINIGALRMQKITILQDPDIFGSVTYTERRGFATSVRCISKNHGCQPYSPECQNKDHSVLKKPDYPLLLIDTFKFQTESVTEPSTSTWMLKEIPSGHDSVPDDTEDIRRLLAMRKDHQPVPQFEKITLRSLGNELYPRFDMLVVPGPSNFKVELGTKMVTFLDWKTREITLITTLLD